jgi:hypothetical protein
MIIKRLGIWKLIDARNIYHIMVGANISFSTVFICQERPIFAESTHFTCKNTFFEYFPKTFTKKSKWAIKKFHYVDVI